MKRTLSVILAVIMMLSTLIVSANAAQSDTETAPTNDTKSKISNELLTIIAEGKEDIVPVYIFLKDCVNTSEVEKYVLENYEGTDTDADKFLKYYRQEIARIVGGYVQQFVDDNKELLEKIIFQPDSAELLIADVKTENIEKLAQISIVNNISYFHNYIAENQDDNNLYEGKFLEWTEKTHDKNSLTDGYRYDELYYHKDSNGNTDWVLVDACYLLPAPAVMVPMTIGGRYILSGAPHLPFTCCYGIYDVNEDTFYDMYDFQDNPERFSGLVDALNELNIGTVIEEPTKPEPTTDHEVQAKKANKMAVTVKDKTVKVKKLKSAKVTVKAITVKNNNGAVSYTKVAKKSSNRLNVNKKGKIIVKKGTKTGNYKIKVKITAKGTKNYKPKTVTKTVKIKVIK